LVQLAKEKNVEYIPAPVSGQAMHAYCIRKGITPPLDVLGPDARAASADQELEVPALAVNQASAHSHLVASQAKASDSSLLSTNQVRAKSQYNHTAMWLLDNLSPASHSSLKINQTTTSSMDRSSHPQPAVTSMTSKPGLTL
jgi:hypothetical protein